MPAIKPACQRFLQSMTATLAAWLGLRFAPTTAATAPPPTPSPISPPSSLPCVRYTYDVQGRLGSVLYHPPPLAPPEYCHEHATPPVVTFTYDAEHRVACYHLSP